MPITDWIAGYAAAPPAPQPPDPARIAHPTTELQKWIDAMQQAQVPDEMKKSLLDRAMIMERFRLMRPQEYFQMEQNRDVFMGALGRPQRFPTFHAMPANPMVREF